MDPLRKFGGHSRSTLLSSSPNFPRASITRYTHAKHEPILNERAEYFSFRRQRACNGKTVGSHLKQEFTYEGKRKHKLAWKKYIDEHVIALTLSLMQRQPTLKWVCHFNRHTFSVIWEKCFAQKKRNTPGLTRWNFMINKVKRESCEKARPWKLFYSSLLSRGNPHPIIHISNRFRGELKLALILLVPISLDRKTNVH